MDIFVRIRITMVMPMMRRPPQGTALNRRIAESSEHKLPESVGFKSIM
jgi:hypothetical protein